VIWPHGLDRLQEFCNHINSIKPTFKFTIEIETEMAMPFLDVLVVRAGATLNIKVYRKPTHTRHYPHFQSNHPRHVKRGVVQSLYYRATVICQEQQVGADEIFALKHDLQLNASSIGSINFVINIPKRKVFLKKEVQPLGFVSIFYIRGVSEKFKLKANKYSIKTVCKMRHNLRNSFMRTRPIGAPQKIADCIFSIPCECGRNYMAETGRPWAVRLREHRLHLEVGYLENPD